MSSEKLTLNLPNGSTVWALQKTSARLGLMSEDFVH